MALQRKLRRTDLRARLVRRSQWVAPLAAIASDSSFDFSSLQKASNGCVGLVSD